jgi:CRP-like cAMP-binding protein
LARAENHLIELLPGPDRLRLLALCEPVEWVLAEVLCEAGALMQHVYFPTDGFITLLAQIDGRPGLEVAMVGREGMLGAQLALGVAGAPLQAVVQGTGSSWRIGKLAFGRELQRSASLRRTVHHYLGVSMAQLAAAAACLRFHLIGPRLARWLLMSQDRMHADSFRITHEVLAQLLGVRRVGITTAAGAMQRGGLIEYRRGHLTVLDRSGLETMACACYAADCRAYKAVLG